jgi:hypothetical protein
MKRPQAVGVRGGAAGVAMMPWVKEARAEVGSNDKENRIRGRRADMWVVIHGLFCGEGRLKGGRGSDGLLSGNGGGLNWLRGVLSLCT